jgi:hypothetical protein
VSKDSELENETSEKTEQEDSADSETQQASSKKKDSSKPKEKKKKAKKVAAEKRKAKERPEDKEEEDDQAEEESQDADADAEDEEQSASEDREDAEDEEQAPAKKGGKESKRQKKERLIAEAEERKNKKDRNARVRQQLMKKKIQAEQVVPLSATEAVDEVIARSASNAGKWLKKNSHILQWAVGFAIIGSIGWGVWRWQHNKKMGDATSLLAFGFRAQEGIIAAPDSTKAKQDVVMTFENDDQRMATAQKAYEKVITDFPNSGHAILAKLGEAGLLLDNQKWDAAIAKYREVKSSPLGGADEDVKGRCSEGIAFALEGKGDLQGALKAFRELASVNAQGFRELALYHQARILASLGEKEKAIEAIKSASDKIHNNELASSLLYIKTAADELYRQLDPKSAPKRKALGGSNMQASADEIAKLQRQIQQKLKEAQENAKKEDHHDHGAKPNLPVAPKPSPHLR